MPERIEVDELKEFSEPRGLKQAILFAWDGERTYAVTWGLTVEDSDQAAAGATEMKRTWGWPKEVAEAKPPRVQGLIDVCRQLELVGLELEASGLELNFPQIMEMVKGAHEALKAMDPEQGESTKGGE